MSKELLCPVCGTRLPLDPKDRAEGLAPAPDPARTIEAVIPSTLSVEDIIIKVPQGGGVVLALPEREGAEVFVAGDTIRPAAEPPVPPPTFEPPRTQPIDGPAVWVAESSSGSGEALTALPPDIAAAAPPVAPSPGSFRVPALIGSSTSASSAGSKASQSVSDEAGAPRGSLGRVLLASYASAMTLACAWLWWQGRHRPDRALPDTLPTDSRPDLEAAGDGARRAAPLPAIAERLRTALDKPLRVDELEVTPLAIERGPVRLVRRDAEGKHESRDGGDDALHLRLRVANRGAEHRFTPLEPSAVREPDRGPPASLIESADGGRVETYPLAVQSEWSIEGQAFPELGPGETALVTVVSDKDAYETLMPSATWRLRLRTSPHRTAVIGVNFQKSEIR